MANVDYEKSAAQIVELVGGKENVNNLTHCITRVRFTLKDTSIAEKNMEAVKSVPGVMSVLIAGGQYQVVIGPAVEKMYDPITKIVGMDGGEVAPNDGETEKKGLADMIMKFISGIMMPVMPCLVGCGLVNAFYVILNLLGLVSADTGIGMVLSGIGNTCFYFFPVIVAASAAKHFGLNIYLGATVGAALIHPTFTAAADAGVSTSLFGLIPFTFQNYSSTVFPAIAAVYFASVVYKFVKKIIPDVLSFAFVPFVTLLITLPVTLVVIGPVVNVLGDLVSKVVLAIYDFSPALCGFVLGATWLFIIVPLGLHWGFIGIFINNYIVLGYEPIMGLLAGILGLSGTLLAIAFMSKDADVKSGAISCAISNALGISEPGLYGYVLTDKKILAASMLGCAIGGIIPGIMHTYVYADGMSGIFALPTYINPDGSMSSLMGAILCNVVSFGLCFLFTCIVKRRDKANA